MRISTFILLLFCLFSCKDPENTPMLISGRIIDSTNSSPLSKYLFQINYSQKGRSGVMGNIDFGATHDLKTNSSGYFQYEFEMSPGTEYVLSNYHYDTIYRGTLNGSLGDILFAP